MKINIYLIIGIIVTIMALYYWIEIGPSAPLREVPFIYAVTFRLLRYFDILWTAAGLLSLFRGIRKLRK